MHLKEDLGSRSVEWIRLAQDGGESVVGFVNTVMNRRVS